MGMLDNNMNFNPQLSNNFGNLEESSLFEE